MLLLNQNILYTKTQNGLVCICIRAGAPLDWAETTRDDSGVLIGTKKWTYASCNFKVLAKGEGEVGINFGRSSDLILSSLLSKEAERHVGVL